MPFYMFRTPAGTRQLFAGSREAAISIFRDTTGVQGLPIDEGNDWFTGVPILNATNHSGTGKDPNDKGFTDGGADDNTGPGKDAGLGWYAVEVPGAGRRFVWGSSQAGARDNARDFLNRLWGTSNEQSNSVLGTFTFVGDTKPGNGAELAWGKPKDWVFTGGTTGTTGTTDTGGTGGTELKPLEETEPRAAFLRGLGSRGDPNTIAGRVERSDSRFDDFLNTFALGQALAGFSTPASAFADAGTPVDMDKFLNFTRQQNIGSVRKNAANSLRSLFSAQDTGGDGLSGLGFLREQFQQPEKEQATALAQLLRTGLESHISPLALRLVRLPSGTDLRDRFLASGESDFLDFVRRNFPTAALGI